MAKDWCKDVCKVDYGKDLNALRAQVSALQTYAGDEIYRSDFRTAADMRAALEEERRLHKHWKDQHANEVKRARILKDTTDLPLERVRAYELMGELQGQVEQLKADYNAIEKRESEAWSKYHTAESERDQLRAEVERLEKRHKEMRAAGVASAGREEGLREARDRAEADLKRRRDHFLEDACEWRGVAIQDACPKCSGAGVRAYGSTSTWQGGIGGQAITADVCDTCWGSGDKHRQGADLRRLRAEVPTSYEKGAESMRERAAKVAERRANAITPGLADYDLRRNELFAIVPTIRALPLKENEG